MTDSDRGGEGGIRTHGTCVHLFSRPDQPLWGHAQHRQSTFVEHSQRESSSAIESRDSVAVSVAGYAAYARLAPVPATSVAACASTLGWMVVGFAAGLGQLALLAGAGVNGWAIVALLCAEVLALAAPRKP